MAGAPGVQRNYREAAPAQKAAKRDVWAGRIVGRVVFSCNHPSGLAVQRLALLCQLPGNARGVAPETSLKGGVEYHAL